MLSNRVAEPATRLQRSTEPTAGPEPLVSLLGISRSWGRGRSARIVLRDLSLELMRGTAAWVQGRNGAGKTTLLRIATGILSPDAGTVRVDGITPDESWREFHRRIGFLSAADRGLFVRLSVRAHLEYWTALAFVPRGERREAVDTALGQFALADLADRRADRLSQGQRQRLRLALAVVHRPKVLLLDEPANSLDVEGVEMLGDAVRETLARGGSTIWCSPVGEHPPVAFDSMLLLEAGRLTPV